MSAASRPAPGPSGAWAIDLARLGWLLDLFFVLSVWNLNFMRSWRLLIFASVDDQYWMPLWQTVDYVALLILVFGGAAASFLVLRAIRRYGVRYGNILFLVFAGAISVGIVEYVRPFVGDRNMLYLFAGLSPVLLWQRSRSLLARAVFIAGLVMAPFALSNLLQAAWHVVTATPASAETGGVGESTTSAPESGQLAAGSAGSAARHRVVWLLFDELDERALFGDRRAGYDFPTFDKFRAQSVHYTQVTGPGGQTVVAMPSLWLGTRVTNAQPVDDDTLLVTLQGASSAVPLADQDHLFRAARKAGLHTALVGYYHPYCRLFKGDYDNCETYYSHIDPRVTESRTLGQALAAHISVFKFRYYISMKIEEFPRSVKAAAAAAADARFDLVAIHAGFPHRPWVYSAKRKQLTLFRSSYLDSVGLADHYLALVREAMQESGVWDRTAVIVTSDHGYGEWRGYDVRTVGAVPFLVKLPYQQQGRDVDCAFDAIVLRRLIEQFLRGEVPSNASLDSCLRAPS